MTIRFDQKIDDIVAFYRHQKFTPKTVRSAARMSAFFAIVPLVLIMALRGAFEDKESKMISLIVIVATYLIAYVILLYWVKKEISDLLVIRQEILTMSIILVRRNSSSTRIMWKRSTI